MSGRGDGPADVVSRLRARGWTLATAESLTAGAVAAAIGSVPGASAVLLGGVVAYAGSVKADTLGVPRSVLDAEGTVSVITARAMATGVRTLLGADVALATTGVAGPDPWESHPPGTVHVAVCWGPVAGDVAVRSALGAQALRGGRAEVRAGAVAMAFALLHEVLDTVDGDHDRPGPPAVRDARG